MLSKNRIRTIRSLENKKGRTESGMFVAEGKKLISDLLDSEIRIELLVSTPQNLPFFKSDGLRHAEVIEVSDDEIRMVSLLKTPQGCLALCRIPQYDLPGDTGHDDLVLCLQDIQDPGNLGTIIRLSDWFGIGDIVCSPSTADVYNPKVVQATMGALSRVRVHYTELIPFLTRKKKSNVPVYGTFPKGENIYTSSLTTGGIVVLGNEGNGISEDVCLLLSRRLTIPGFHNVKPESLNVATAAAIVISEFRRRVVYT